MQAISPSGFQDLVLAGCLNDSHQYLMSTQQQHEATLGRGSASEWQSVGGAVMGSLPAEVRRKKVLPFCRLFYQSPDMESQVARCMAQQFPTVLSQVGTSSTRCITSG